MISRKKNIALNYLVLGFCFGLTFPIVGIAVDCFVFNSVEMSFKGISEQIFDNPIHFIILLAPVVLGATFYSIGRAVSKQNGLNKKLARVNSSMRNTNELLDTFNYHVSHDLKTVLNNQLILSKMMQKYVEKEDFKKINEIAKKITASGENGLETVMSFLKISREGFITNSELKKSLNISEEINRILTENNLEDKIDVKLLKKDFEEISIGNKVFESIILNLFTNAIKYNSSDLPRMEIELNKSAKAKKILFKDNGIGIDLKKNGARLFQPFNRIENSKKTEGTGIGLFLIKKMLNSIGGEISVESELGKGTQFIITFYEMK